MTVWERLGQGLITGASGTVAGAEAERLIDGCRVGGLILFTESVQTPTRVAQLNRDLQYMARRPRALWPLFIANDQGSGSAARIRDELGHAGITITAAMAMKGVTSRYRIADAVVVR